MNKLMIYQCKDKFIFTRQQEKKEMDSEELLRNLEIAREQLKEHKKSIQEFERDIKEMEKLEPLARRIRDDEVNMARKMRSQLK